MASGYFPLSPSDVDAKKLSACISMIHEIVAEHTTAASDLNSEDAFRDGQYIGELNLAARLISGCIR